MKHLMLLFCLLSVIITLAQSTDADTRIIKGLVTDKATKTIPVGANAIQYETINGAVVQADGIFELKVSKTDTVLIHIPFCFESYYIMYLPTENFKKIVLGKKSRKKSEKTLKFWKKREEAHSKHLIKTVNSSHMKKGSLFILLCLSCLSIIQSFGQQKIQYGSNNGKYLSIFNSKIYYEEYGKGAPLLLLQGGMGSIRDFSLCIPDLSKRFRVIAPDSPGQGRSSLADSMSYELMAEYFSKMIDLLKLDSVYVMGWSDGGNAALILANNRPDKVKKVIASGANYKLSAFNSGNDDWLKPVTPEWEVQNKKWIDAYMKTSPRDWKKFVNDMKVMWAQKIYFSPTILEGIKVPVMIVLGDRDAVTLEHGIEMHRLIKGSQFCVLPNTSHGVFHERAKLINEMAIDFFRK